MEENEILDEKIVPYNIENLMKTAYIDDDCKIWAKAAVNKDLYVAKGTVLLALSAIDKDVKEEGRTLFGMPAGDATAKWREMAMMRKLPDLFKELEEIKKRLP